VTRVVIIITNGWFNTAAANSSLFLQNCATNWDVSGIITWCGTAPAIIFARWHPLWIIAATVLNPCGHSSFEMGRTKNPFQDA